MAGKTSWNLATTLIAVALNVVLDVVLIPPYGIVGAAIGWCAAILASNVVPLVVAWRGLGLHPFGRATLQATLFALGAFAVLPLAGRIAAGLPGTIMAAVIGAGAYAALVWRRRELFDLAGMRRRRPVTQP
jgi:O-antigen/teichoic acid export membrane protein